MTDWDRLTAYMYDYFPDPSYDTDDIEEWAEDNVPAWKYMDKETKTDILGDWEDFIAPQVEAEIETVFEGVGQKTPSFWGRIKNFLKRWF